MPWDKQYDETDVLERAMMVFWTKGYEATSVSDLVAATGIHRGSIYAAFVDKHGLFLRVLEHYDRHHRIDFLAKIESEHDPKSAILEVFEDAKRSALAGNAPSGCLLINAALERAEYDPAVAEMVHNSLTGIEQFFRRKTEEARARAQVRPSLDPTQTGAILLTMFLGLRVVSRSCPDAHIVTAIANQVRAQLE